MKGSDSFQQLHLPKVGNNVDSSATFASELYSSTIYSALEAPVLGFTQLVQPRGTDLCGLIKGGFSSIGVHEQKDLDFNSGAWYGQTIGSGLGMLVPAGLIAMGTKRYFGGAELQPGVLNERSAIGLSLKESAATGLVYGTMFTPTEGKDLPAERLMSGIGMSASFTLMTGSVFGLSKAGTTHLAERFGLKGVLQNPISLGMISGIPGGFINSEIDAYRERRGPADTKDILQNIWGMSVVGGAFGAKAHLFGAKIAVGPEKSPDANGIDQGSATDSFRTTAPDSSILTPVTLDRGGQYSKPAGREVTSVPEATLQMLDRVRAATEEANLLLEQPVVQRAISTPLDSRPEVPKPLANALAEPTIPAATVPWTEGPGGMLLSAWRNGTVAITSDGRTIVHDHFSQTTQVFDRESKLVSVTAVRGGQTNHQQYVRDTEGELRAVLFSGNHGWFRDNQGWAEGFVNRENNKFALFPSEFKFGAIDPDAGFYLGNGDKGFSIPVNNRYRTFDRDGIAVDQVDSVRENRQAWDRVVWINDPETRARHSQALYQLDTHIGKGVGGGGQILADFNRNLANGSPEGLALLESANELLKNKNLTTLKNRRDADGQYRLSASGYEDGAHVIHFTDGTKTRTDDAMRTVHISDKLKILQYLDRKETVHALTGDDGLFTFETPIGELRRSVTYKTGRGLVIDSLTDTVAGKTNELTHEDGNWKLKMSIAGHESISTSVELGPGKVELDGKAASFAPSDSPQLKYVLNLDGSVARMDSLRETTERISAGEPIQLTSANLDKEIERAEALTQRGVLPPEALDLSRGEQTDKVSNKHKALILAELTRQGEVDKALVEQALPMIRNALTNSNERDLAVYRLPDGAIIRLGNTDITLSHTEGVTSNRNLLRTEDLHDPQFRQTVAGQLGNLHPAIHNLLIDEGVSVVASNRAHGVVPKPVFDEVQPTWPPNMNAENVTALYDARTRTAYITSQHLDYNNGKTAWQKAGESDRPLMMVLGRAIDQALGFYSDTPEFNRAFNRDQAGLSLSDVRQLARYTQSPQSGKRLLFADMFAAMEGSSPDPLLDPLLKKHFPRAYEAVQIELGKVKAGEPMLTQEQPSIADSDKGSTVDEHKISPEKPTVAELLSEPGPIRPEPSENAKRMPEATGASTTLEHGRSEILGPLRVEYMAANLDYERSQFKLAIAELPLSAESIQIKFARQARLEDSMERFARRASEGASPEGSVALTLRQLNRLLADSPDAQLSRIARVDLAEQLLAYFNYAPDISQGNHPTCNVAVIQHRMAVLEPEEVARIVADMAIDRRYIYRDGRSTKVEDLVGGLKPDREAESGLNRQRFLPTNFLDDGLRSWSSQIVQSVLIHAAWLDKSLHVIGDRILPERAIVSVEDYDNGGQKLVRVDPDRIRPVGEVHPGMRALFTGPTTVSGSTLQTDFVSIRDAKGNWVSQLDPGQTGYNQFGEPLVTKIAPGDISFGIGPDGAENLKVRIGDKMIPLREESGALAKSPKLTSIDIARAQKLISDKDPEPFLLTRDDIGSSSIKSVKSKEELIEAINNLKKTGRLPGIIQVRRRQFPFNQYGLARNDDGHVMNVYDHIPETDKIRLSNQWTRAAHFMGEGLSSDVVFNAMGETFDPPRSPAIVPPIPRIDPSILSWLKFD